MIFAFTAINARGERLSETLEAADLSAAQQELLRRGLSVLSLDAKGRLPAIGAGGALLRRNGPVRPSARGRELALFARQMSMMLRAGASVVPAMRAILEQPGRPGWHALLSDLVERIESGTTVHDAMARYPNAFPGTQRSIIAAGEATGTLSDAFARLGALLDGRERIRKRVIGALAYPGMLLCMASSVVVTMTCFVLPRFASLFKMLDTPLPPITRAMLDVSEFLQHWWMLAVPVPVAVVVAAVLWIRSPAGREMLGRVVLRLPIVGRAVSGVLLARLLQTWAALLRSRVSLLDTIRQTRDAVSNPVFSELIDGIELAITEGRQMSPMLKHSRLVPAPIAATIATGEESGRLGEAMDFAANWLEEENDALIKSITRLLEPAILIVMGLVVGAVCIALFLPLFDVATAAG